MPPHFINNYVPERFVEVDAARLLLILNRFSVEVDDDTKKLRCWPKHPVVRFLTPEYYLQKLDFLLRNPGYFAYELMELHRKEWPAASNRVAIMDLVRNLLSDREPDLRTDQYRKFLRGAYERIDLVEAWWHSRRLVFTRSEQRGVPGGGARPQKYFFLTAEAEVVASNLIANVEHAHWYDSRIQEIRLYFGGFTPTQIKELQYSHEPYRQAQLQEMIPNLPLTEISANFFQVFGEEVGCTIE